MPVRGQANGIAGANLPFELDPDHYRRNSADLATLDNDAAAEHFRTYGESEGRDASPATFREGFLKEVVSKQAGSILEIGPFCNPLLKGRSISYLDILDASSLRQRAVEMGLDPGGCPAKIDFVGDISVVDRSFAAVVSSHAIEHQPDLVRHLKRIADLLDAGGRYYLIIPDKRYCFDTFVPESSIASVMQAHHDRRTRHTLQSVIEHHALNTHNDGPMHWAGMHGEAKPANQEERIAGALRDFKAAKGGYIDVHAWYFTPAVFRRITEALFNLNLTGLYPARVYNTPKDRFEFCAVLEKR